MHGQTRTRATLPASSTRRISGEDLQAGRLNNAFFFSLGQTIRDDDEDKLTSGSGKDWFILTGNDKATDVGENDETN